jgi:peptide deformylase
MPISDLVEQLLAGLPPLSIVTAGDPVLRQPTVPYDGQLGADLFGRLIEAMRITMHDAPGVGLAAPQVGIPLRLAVIEDPADGLAPENVHARARTPLPFRVLVNPRYEPVGDQIAEFYEGCLSVPGWQAVVSRPLRVRLHGQDEHGRELDEEFHGWPARIVQHETDHLDGTIYLDRAIMRSLSANEHALQRWTEPSPVRAAAELGFPLRGI